MRIYIAIIALLLAALTIAGVFLIDTGYDEPAEPEGVAEKPNRTASELPETTSTVETTPLAPAISEDGYVGYLDQFGALTEVDRTVRLDIGYWACQQLYKIDSAALVEAMAIGTPSISDVAESSVIVAGATGYLCPTAPLGTGVG